MLSWLRTKITYANLASTLALSLALGTGGAYAADRIGSSDIKKGAVTAAKIKKGAVTAAKVRSNAIDSKKVRDASLTGADLADGSVTAADLASSVTSGLVADIAGKASRSQTIRIPGLDFRSADPANTVASTYGAGAYVSASTTGNQSVAAPVRVPVGSIVTSVTYHFRDAVAAADINFRLEAPTLSGSYFQVVEAAATTEGASGLNRSLTRSGFSVEVTPHRWLAVSASVPSWHTRGGDISVVAVDVTYTMP